MVEELLGEELVGVTCRPRSTVRPRSRPARRRSSGGAGPASRPPSARRPRSWASTRSPSRTPPAISLAASAEAAALLDGMELRLRMLNTHRRDVERRGASTPSAARSCGPRRSRHGPTRSATTTCSCASTDRRGASTPVENQILVFVLEAIARAGRALQGADRELVDPDEVERISRRGRRGRPLATCATHWPTSR